MTWGIAMCRCNACGCTTHKRKKFLDPRSGEYVTLYVCDDECEQQIIEHYEHLEVRRVAHAR